ncbi:hypothetical protein K9M48_03935 [Candidatus Gracilibacteria bacterium]|nr:hypothetical protein [Candidatus Gracilibacteria bacterium]
MTQRLTDQNIKKNLDSLIQEMKEVNLSILLIREFDNILQLPSGGFVGAKKIRVFLKINGKTLIIIKTSRDKDTGSDYEYDPYSNSTIMWMKDQKIRLPEELPEKFKKTVII